MLLSILLFFNEASVDTLGVLLKELVIVALFDELTGLHDDDFIGIFNGGKTMGNNDNGNVTSLLSVFVDGGLDSFLIYSVEGGGSFVEKKDLWFF